MRKKIKLEIAFDCGDICYLVSDEEQIPHLVVGVLMTPIGLCYQVRYGTEEITEHYEIELTDTPKVT